MILKKGIKVYADYDKNGRWCLKMQKAKGRFTLDEIIESAKEYEWDFYLLVIDAYHDNEEQFRQAQEGDFVTLYRTDLFFEEGER